MRALALSIAVVLVASSVHAEDATRPRVQIAVCADDTSAKAIEGSVRDLLSQVDVDLTVSRAETIDPREVVLPPETFEKTVRVWIDVHGTTARVYLADAAWERVLVRAVPMPNGPDEIAREQIAHIVAGSIEALMSGATIGVGREDARVSLGVKKPETPKRAPPPPPAPAPKAKPIASRPGYRLGLGIGYDGALHAPGVLSHSLGVWADARGADAALSPWVAASALFRAPIVIEREPIGLRLDTIGTRVLVGGVTPIAPSLSVRFGIGGGIDVLRVEPRARAGAGTEVEPVRTTIAPILRAIASFDLRLSSSSFASFGVAAEADVLPRRFIVLANGRPEEVLAPYRVRPAIVLSITSQLW